MKKVFISLLLQFCVLSVYSQSLDDYDFYIVTDPDGFVNKRTGPGTIFKISEEKIYDKQVVFYPKKEAIKNGWIPVVNIYMNTGDSCIVYPEYPENKNICYIHRSRLNRMRPD